jgi:hypothetical protein
MPPQRTADAVGVISAAPCKPEEKESAPRDEPTGALRELRAGETHKGGNGAARGTAPLLTSLRFHILPTNRGEPVSDLGMEV